MNKDTVFNDNMRKHNQIKEYDLMEKQQSYMAKLTFRRPAYYGTVQEVQKVGDTRHED